MCGFSRRRPASFHDSVRRAALLFFAVTLSLFSMTQCAPRRNVENNLERWWRHHNNCRLFRTRHSRHVIIGDPVRHQLSVVFNQSNQWLNKVSNLYNNTDDSFRRNYGWLPKPAFFEEMKTMNQSTFLRKIQTQFQIFCATFHRLQSMKVDTSDGYFDNHKRRQVFEDVISRTSLILTEINQEMADTRIEPEPRPSELYEKIRLPKEVDMTTARTYDISLMKRYVKFLKKVSRKAERVVGKARRGKKPKNPQKRKNRGERKWRVRNKNV